MKRINIIFFFLCFFFYLSAPAYSQANLDSLAIAAESGDAEDLYQLGRAYDEACALLDYSDSNALINFENDIDEQLCNLFHINEKNQLYVRNILFQKSKL